MMDKRNSDLEQKQMQSKAKAAGKGAAVSELEKDEHRTGKESIGPLKLLDVLTGLTKSELSNIRARLAIRGLSSLNKQQLAEALAMHLPQSLGAIIDRFDEARYKLIRHIVDRGGVTAMSHDYWEYEYLRGLGLITFDNRNDEPVIIMPQEIMAQFHVCNTAELREKISSNTEIIKLVKGMLYYYGVLKFEDMEQLLSRYVKDSFVFKEIMELLADASEYDIDFVYESYGCAYYRVESPEVILAEQESRADLNFYGFTLNQLMEAGETDYYDRHPVFEAMTNFIFDQYSLTRHEAAEIVEECACAIRNGSPPSMIIDLLQHQLEMDTIETVQSFMGHVSLLNNLTKQWFIKGHTPNDLSYRRNGSQVASSKNNVIDLLTRKKVGRNELCPCGSGKKYKKCCGR